jgi:probable blue pigment (indigoidine) exporter
VPSVEDIWRWRAITVVAPVVWGSTYFVTRHLLPADHPLWGSALRALPAGLILLLLARRLPHGAWWWRALLLGVLNAGLFFVLVYVAAQLLPTAIASVVMAGSPLVMMALAALLLGQSLRARSVAGGLLGLAGVAVMLFSDPGSISILGVGVAAAAMVMSSLGFILAMRWSGDIPILASTSWQLLVGGLVVLPFAAIIEGAPPAPTPGVVLGFLYLTLVATALAYVAWFLGLRHLGPTDVGLIGLLNPVTGVLLGVLVAGEHLDGRQLAGMAILLAGVVLGQRARSGAVTPVSGEDPADEPGEQPVAEVDRQGLDQGMDARRLVR